MKKDPNKTKKYNSAVQDKKREVQRQREEAERIAKNHRESVEEFNEFTENQSKPVKPGAGDKIANAFHRGALKKTLCNPYGFGNGIEPFMVASAFVASIPIGVGIAFGFVNVAEKKFAPAYEEAMNRLNEHINSVAGTEDFEVKKIITGQKNGHNCIIVYGVDGDQNVSIYVKLSEGATKDLIDEMEKARMNPEDLDSHAYKGYYLTEGKRNIQEVNVSVDWLINAISQENILEVDSEKQINPENE